MSADTLTLTSRTFYERSKAKLAISLALGAISMFFLGFCSSSGGVSRAQGDYESQTDNDDGAHNAQQSGYGIYDYALFKMQP